MSDSMKAIDGYFLIKPEDLFWRPSNLMKIPNADYLERTGRCVPQGPPCLGARLWRFTRRPKVGSPVGAGLLKQGIGIGIDPGDLFHGRSAVGIFLQACHDDDHGVAEHIVS